MTLVSFFFFFQAEDGIRDLTVTGVQTCALPISFAVNLFPLLLEQRNDRVGCVRIEFGAICFFNSTNVSREFDRCDLHAKTKPEIRNPILASVTRRFNFSFDAALSESARN